MVTIVFYSILICRICELSGVYHEGDFRADSAWPYLTFIDSVSQTVSSCVRAHVCVCVHAMSVSSCYECVFMLCVCVHAMHVFMLCVCHECLWVRKHIHLCMCMYISICMYAYLYAYIYVVYNNNNNNESNL